MKYTQITLALLIIAVHMSYSMENNGKELTSKTDHSELTQSQTEDIYTRIGKPNKEKEFKINNEKTDTELKDLAEKMKKMQEKKFWLELKYNVIRVALVGIAIFAVGSKLYVNNASRAEEQKTYFYVCSQNNPSNCHTIAAPSDESCISAIGNQLSKYFGENETLSYMLLQKK